MANGKDLLPSVEELEKLCPWARVVFAARCAQRVFPLVEEADSEGRYSLQIAKGIGQVLNVAANGKRYSTLHEHVLRVAEVADHFSETREAAARAIQAAVDATRVADALWPSSLDAYSAALNSYEAAKSSDFDIDLHNCSVHLVVSAVERDLGLLRSMSQQVGPSDLDTPIDYRALGQLWPGEVPYWYYDSELLQKVPDGLSSGDGVTISGGVMDGLRGVYRGKTPDKNRAEVLLDFLGAQTLIATSFEQLMPVSEESLPSIQLHFEVGQASTKSLQRVMEGLSKLNIAAGGAGLEFRPDDGYIHVRERAEV